MTALYYECFAGISGDMNVAALLDLGVDVAYLRAELAKLNLAGEFELTVERADKNGIYGNKVTVILTEQSDDSHQHNHHAARDFKQIVQLIENSALSARVKRDSIAIFEIIARAEGKVHNIDYQAVHFHEVGAVDSIVDIVATAICMESLNASEIIVSDIEVGSGFVNCAHGQMPVPAPATAEILLGFKIKQSVEGFEMTTPTGAAILKYYGRQVSRQTVYNGQKIGYGLGRHDVAVPNLLRVTLLADEVVNNQLLIESNIDDLSPEKLAFVQQKLFAIGARDVFLTPIVMKKGRLAHKLSLIVDDGLRQSVLDIIFRHSSAIGARIIAIEKIELDRKTLHLETDYGKLPVKIVCHADKIVNYKAEYDDCKAAAERHQVTLTDIDRAVIAALSERGIL